MAQPKSKKECELVLAGLLSIPRGKGVMYIRELMSTSSCDVFNPKMKDRRSAHSSYIGLDRLDRITLFQENSVDHRVANASMSINARSDRSAIFNTLPFWRRVKYYTLDALEAFSKNK